MEWHYEAYCSMPKLDEKVSDILYKDDLQMFESAVDEGLVSNFYLWPQEMLSQVVQHGAVRCATALIKGDIRPFTVYLNETTVLDAYVLHEAAYFGHPGMTELLLHYGARTDLRCVLYLFKGCHEKLPLNVALEKLRISFEVKEWSTEQSVFKLLTILCLPRMQNHLETISLLAWTTEETEREFLCYAKDGKIFELAVLLMVARKKIYNSIETVKRYVQDSLLSHDDNSSPVFLQMHQLFDVFEKLGDALEEYIKQDKAGVTKLQTMEDVASYLSQAGFILKPTDTNLRDYIWSKKEDETAEMMRFSGPWAEFIKEAKDIGMAHYSKSGYRWTRDSVAAKATERSELTEKKMNCVIPSPSEPWTHTRIPAEVPSLFEVAAKESHLPVGMVADTKKNGKQGKVDLQNFMASNRWASLFSALKRIVRK